MPSVVSYKTGIILNYFLTEADCMFLEPSQTTPSRFVKLDGVVRDIEAHILHSGSQSQLIPINNKLGIPAYMLVAGSMCKAKPFGIPITFNNRGTESLVVDARHLTSPSVVGGYRVSNLLDFNHLRVVATLTAVWMSKDKHFLHSTAMDLAPIFATWFSTTLSSTLGLPLEQRGELSIVAAYYYLSLIGVETNKLKLTSKIAIDLKFEYDWVESILANVGELTDLASYVEALKTTSAGIRLDKVDTATLYQVSAGVWKLDAVNRGMTEVAMEYPPIVIAMTYTALTDRSYRKLRFYDYVSLFERRREIQDLPNALKTILNSQGE